MAELNAAGNITGTDGTVEIAPGDNATVAVALEGTWVATVNYEVTYDGVRWDAAQVFTLAGVAAAATATTNGDRLIDARGVMQARVRANPYTSGSIGVVLTASEGVVAAGGGGGGGGAVTVADGADVTQGTTTDAAAAADTTNTTIVAFWKRLLQRVTVLIGQLPAALVGGRLDVNIGAAAATVPISATSLPLPTGAAADATVGTTNTEIGGLTETAPATDIASSGLNGRLQRVAQRLTSLIGLLPAALVGGRLDVNVGATGVTQPVSGTVTANQGTQNGAGTASWPVQGAGAAAAALSGNPVLQGASDGANAQTLRCAPINGGSFAAGATGVPAALPYLFGSGNTLEALNGLRATTADNYSGAGMYGVAGWGYNGAGFDRLRDNVDVTDLVSASRTTTQTLADITVFNGHSLIVTLDVTTVGTGSVTLTINYKDPASGKYILLLSGAAVTTNVTNMYTVNTRLAATLNVNAQKDLGRVIQLVLTSNNANPVVSSLGHTVVS